MRRRVPRASRSEQRPYGASMAARVPWLPGNLLITNCILPLATRPAESASSMRMPCNRPRPRGGGSLALDRPHRYPSRLRRTDRLARSVVLLQTRELRARSSADGLPRRVVRCMRYRGGGLHWGSRRIFRKPSGELLGPDRREAAAMLPINTVIASKREQVSSVSAGATGGNPVGGRRRRWPLKGGVLDQMERVAHAAHPRAARGPGARRGALRNLHPRRRRAALGALAALLLGAALAAPAWAQDIVHPRVLMDTQITVGGYRVEHTTDVDEWGYAAGPAIGGTDVAATVHDGSLGDAAFVYQGVEYTVKRLTISIEQCILRNRDRGRGRGGPAGHGRGRDRAAGVADRRDRPGRLAAAGGIGGG